MRQKAKVIIEVPDGNDEGEEDDREENAIALE